MRDRPCRIARLRATKSRQSNKAAIQLLRERLTGTVRSADVLRCDPRSDLEEHPGYGR